MASGADFTVEILRASLPDVLKMTSTGWLAWDSDVAVASVACKPGVASEEADGEPDSSEQLETTAAAAAESPAGEAATTAEA